MNISLESGLCPNCGAENSIHINDCRACHRQLPWAGTEQTKIPTLPTGRPKQQISRGKVVWVYVCGITVFSLGAISFVYSLLAHLPPSGFLWMIVGGGWFGYANNLAMNIDEMPG